ncbi:tachykinin-like peptides receptor 86C [Uloborus diversus]|uniref:tachykinin-like peptides receptor 86C n=1 Tax=Uloborus diversus TaxID=327109 RepID=UPI00240A71BD|nr:tachykinin-like peptides receptor 86C [Uloborus diversus]
MGNKQQKAADLLDFYLRDPAAGNNVTLCQNQTSNNSENTWEECDPHFVEDALLSQPHLLPLTQQVICAALFGATILVAVAGNAIVSWIILAHSRMRTIRNLFLLNLAIADFLRAGNASFNFVFMLKSHWPFGEVLCIFSNFIANISVSTSGLTLFAMIINRYIAILRPRRPSLSKGWTYVTLCAVWLNAAALSSPSLMYSTTKVLYADRGHRTICYMVWPDGPAGHSYTDYLYQIVFSMATYVVPLSSMAITCIWVGCVRETLGNSGTHSEQKGARMMYALGILLGVCWLPHYIGYFLYYNYQEELRALQAQPELTFYLISLSKCCWNPIIYYLMDKRVRSFRLEDIVAKIQAQLNRDASFRRSDKKTVEDFQLLHIHVGSLEEGKPE